MENKNSYSHNGLNIKRLEALTDGIFAIAMTILVLAIDIPPISSDMVGLKLHNTILGQGDQLIAYGMSFLLLALFWTINHRQLNCFNKTNSLHIWINIMLLIFVCLVPYTTSLKSDFPNDWMTNLYFNINMLIVGLLFLINWNYATKNNRLIYDDFPKSQVIRGKKNTLIFVLISVIATLCSFIIPAESSYIYILIPLLKYIQGKSKNISFAKETNSK